MELINLKTLLAVVDEGGIKGAAKHLNTVPSNISARLQRLEREFDAPLLERKGRKLHPTRCGHVLIDHARQMLLFERQAIAAVKHAAQQAEVNLGSPESFTSIYLPGILQHLQSHTDPVLQTKIHTATSAELIAQVLDRELDCAFVGGAVAHPELHIQPLCSEEIVLVTPKHHQNPETLIIRNPGCAYRDRALRWLDKTGRHFEQRMVLGSIDGLLGCVAAGLGYTLISREMIHQSRYEADLTLTKLSSEDACLELTLVYRLDSQLRQEIAQIEASAVNCMQAPATQ